MSKNKATVPDAWEDDWETQADVRVFTPKIDRMRANIQTRSWPQSQKSGSPNLKSGYQKPSARRSMTNRTDNYGRMRMFYFHVHEKLD